jgi:hypothetical protein
MSIAITLTNGSVKTYIPDGSVDQLSTDLVLVGKNVSSYGAYINDNFVHLLENFANTSQPNYPLLGQLWYDTSIKKLKVYNGLSFVSTSSISVASNQPTSLLEGDLFINSTTGQLYFNDGLATRLAGPVYTKDQGLSGFEVATILDVDNISHTVLYLKLGTSLLGVFAKERFLPRTNISGYAPNTYLEVGFNVSAYDGVAFNVPVSTASYLIASDGTTRPPESFVSTTDSQVTMSGQLIIENDTPLVLGRLNNTEIYSTAGSFTVQSQYSNQNFQLNLKSGSTDTNNIFINASTQKMGVLTNAPTQTLDVNGTLAVRGAVSLGTIGSPQAITTLGNGNRYEITTVGSSDFTAIGADSNTVGVQFIATGAGTGSGFAKLIVTSLVSGATDPTSSQDVATKHYVDTRPLPLYVNDTNNSNISAILIKVFPADEHFTGTVSRVVCSDNSVRKFQLTAGGAWNYVSTL